MNEHIWVISHQSGNNWDGSSDFEIEVRCDDDNCPHNDETVTLYFNIYDGNVDPDEEASMDHPCNHDKFYNKVEEHVECKKCEETWYVVSESDL